MTPADKLAALRARDGHTDCDCERCALLAVAEAALIYDGLCAAYDNGLCSAAMVEDAMRTMQDTLARLGGE